MNSKVERQTIDLPAFPDLVVIYLGMRVNAWTGLRTLFGLGPQIKTSVDQKPDGLLLHENFIMSLIPPHVGMRQYWRDFDALEAWSRSAPHRQWWQDFLRSSRGTGFWHETYFMPAAWRRFTTTCLSAWASDNSHHSCLLGGGCFRRGHGLSWVVSRLRGSFKRPNFMASRAWSSSFGSGERGSRAPCNLAIV
jgi:Domain of unknown function (DUF4188)